MKIVWTVKANTSEELRAEIVQWLEEQAKRSFDEQINAKTQREAARRIGAQNAYKWAAEFIAALRIEPHDTVDNEPPTAYNVRPIMEHDQ